MAAYNSTGEIGIGYTQQGGRWWFAMSPTEGNLILAAQANSSAAVKTKIITNVYN